MAANSRRFVLILFLVLVAGAALRLVDVGWGLPSGVIPGEPPIHPDEAPTWAQGARILRGPDPIAFAWGGVLYIRLAGLVRSLVPAADSMRATLLVLRVLNVLFAAGAAVLVAGIGKRLFGPAVGLTAAALFLLFPGPVLDAHYARPETLLVLLVTASLACGARVVTGGGRAWLLGGAMLGGLAAATSLWGGVAFGGLFGAWLEARPAGGRRLSGRNLAGLPLLALGGALGYLLGSLETLLFWETFRVRWELSQAAHRGAWTFPGAFLTTLAAFAFGALPVLLAAGGAVLAAARRRPGTLLLLGVVVAAVLLLGSQRTRMMRYTAGFAPVVALLAALALHALPRWRAAAIAVTLLAVLQLSASYVLPLAGEDPRYRTAERIEAESPGGVAIGVTRSFRGDDTYVPRFRRGTGVRVVSVELYEDFDAAAAIRTGPAWIVTTDYARQHATGESGRRFLDLLEEGATYRLAFSEGPPWRPLSVPVLLGADRPDDLLYARATFRAWRRR